MYPHRLQSFRIFFYREHLLGIEEDVLGVLVASHPDLESVSLDLLQQIFNVVRIPSVFSYVMFVYIALIYYLSLG